MAWKVGIVGCGVISAAHLKGWRKVKNASVEGVFDLDRSLAKRRAKEFEVGRVHDSLESLIESCDVVDVCTPPQTHADIATLVVEAGRHLLIEKPLVTSIEEWERLSSLIAKSGVKVAVVHNLKFVSSVRKAKRWITAGKIGDVIAVSRQFLTSPADDRMLQPGGHWSHGLPGGRWFETMPHEMYLIHYFAGPLDMSSVTVVRTSTPPPGVQGDEVFVTLKGNECLGMVHFSGNCGLNRRTLQVYGTRGMITIDLLSDAAYLSTVSDTRIKRAVGRMFIEGAQIVGNMLPDRLAYVLRHLGGITPHAVIIEEFARHLDDEGPAPTPLEEIDYVVRNCDRIGRAIDLKAAKSPNAPSELEHKAVS